MKETKITQTPSRGRAKGSPRPEGSGRKPAHAAGAKVAGSYRVAPDVKALIDAQPPGQRNAFLEAAVREKAARDAAAAA